MGSVDEVRPDQIRRAEFRRAWPVVLASAFGAGAGAVPLAFYSFGAFVEPLSQAFGWTRAEITAAPLFLTIGGLFAGVLAGAMADRFGARRVILVSQAFLVIAFAGFALLPASLPLFYLGYALVAVLGAGTMTMTWSRAITGWFIEGRGLALGLSLVGTGLIGALLPTYINWLVETHGWRAAYLGLAALPLIFGLPLTFLFFREPAAEQAGGPAGSAEAATNGHGFAEALKTRCFWQMALSFTVVAFAIASVIVHCVPLLTDRGISAGSAAALAGLIGIAVTVGRLISGFLLDRMHGPTVAFAMFGLPALSCLLLTVSGDNLVLCGVAIVLIGLAGGAEHDIAAYFCAKYFGRHNYGKIYGLLYTLYGVGSGIGPLAAGRMVDATGSYTASLYAGAILFLTSAGIIVTLRPPPTLARQV
ncbi:MAG: MFS transporter [Novosphingobium sp.]